MDDSLLGSFKKIPPTSVSPDGCQVYKSCRTPNFCITLATICV